MTDFVVGAKFSVTENKIAPAAEATADQLEKLRKMAAEADAAVARLVEGQGKSAKGAADQAKEIERVEAQLAKYLARVSEDGKAVKIQAEGHALLNRARELGIVTQAQYERGMETVAKATEKARLTTDNLMKGKLSLGEAVKVGTIALGTMAGTLLGNVANLVLSELGTLAYRGALALLGGATDEVTRAHERLGEILGSAQLKGETAKQSSGERARAYRAETANLRDLAQAEIDRARAGLAAEEARLKATRASTTDPGEAFGTLLQDRRIEQQIKTIAEMEAKLAAFEFKRGYEQPSETGNAKPPKPTTGSGSRTARVSDVEKDLLRQADAAIKARRALDDYGEATTDIVEKARAEFTGRADIIAQIELEAQLRKKYGVEWVAQHQDRIVVMAQERAAAQRVADQYKATTQFIDGSADQIGTALNASLVAPLDRTAEGLKKLEDQWMSTVSAIINEANRLLIINPLLNAITGNNSRPTAYGAGGLLDLILGSGSGGGTPEMNVARAHQGGVAGEIAASRVVSIDAFRNAKRYHSGGFAGDEVPIIARRGEPIFTPKQMENADGLVRTLASRGSEPPIINIIDQRGANAPPAEVRQRRGAGGRLETDVIVKEGGKKAIGEGAWDGVMQTRYGIVPRAA